MKNVGFMRHLRQEWNKEKRATFGSTFIPFQSVELSLPGLLLSRASVRLTQPDKDKLTVDTVYFTLPKKGQRHLKKDARDHKKDTRDLKKE